MTINKDELLCRESGPKGYIAWNTWVEKKHKNGYRQRKCKKCGYYHVWTKTPNQTVEKGKNK